MYAPVCCSSSTPVRPHPVNFDGHLRTGLLLEDMDALAANVANAHAQLRREEGYALVTASVDSIHGKLSDPLVGNCRLRQANLCVTCDSAGGG